MKEHQNYEREATCKTGWASHRHIKTEQNDFTNYITILTCTHGDSGVDIQEKRVLYKQTSHHEEGNFIGLEILKSGSCAWKIDQLPVLVRVAFPLKEHVCSLELLLDTSLLLEVQETSVAWSAFYQLRLVCQPQLYLENLPTIVHSLVMGYCNVLYLCKAANGADD